jgi:hypothetical protein
MRQVSRQKMQKISDEHKVSEHTVQTKQEWYRSQEVKQQKNTFAAYKKTTTTANRSKDNKKQKNRLNQKPKSKVTKNLKTPQRHAQIKNQMLCIVRSKKA